MGNICSGENHPNSNLNIPELKKPKRLSNNSILNPIDIVSNEKQEYLEYLYPTILRAIHNNNEKNEIFISLKLPTYSNNNYKEFLEIINSGIYSNKVITTIHMSKEEVVLSLEA
jgi:hypothetical protein